MRVDSAGVVPVRRTGAKGDGAGPFVSRLAWNVVLALAIGAVAALVIP